MLSPTACPKDGRGLLKERGGKGVQCCRGGARRVYSLFMLNPMYLELRFALAGMPLSENSSESEAPDYGGDSPRVMRLGGLRG